MDNCPKCRSGDLHVKFVDSGSVINSSARKKINDEFVSSSEYDFYYKQTAEIEHLYKHCRTCQYGWRERCADCLGPI